MRLAAIDIGTNSVHMIVVEVRPDLSFETIDRDKEMVRLGAGGLDGRPLSDGAMGAALEALSRFRQLAVSRQVDEIIATATSAVREAPNGGEFLAALAARTGIRPRVISGDEEARLVHLAAVYGVNAATGNTVVVDIGGGSMEVTLGTGKEIRLARSFQLGVIRLTERFVTSDPLSERDERKLVKHVRGEVGEFADQVRAAGFERVIATSGTSLALGEVALSGRRLFDGEKIHHSRISAKELHRSRKDVVSRGMARRLRLPGLDARRADLIVAGAVLLDSVVRLLGAEEITLSDYALREGLVLDFIERNRGQIARTDRYPDIRRRSVFELADRCRWYQAHSEQVARLALSLFDQTRGIHGGTDREREWLEFAGLLHDIGGHIAYEGHHRHSYYLIRNGGLRGFEPEEIEAIALMARYHRRGQPRKAHGELSSMPRATRRAVRLAAAILRIAESLDRSHAQIVERVELRPRRDGLKLVVHAKGPVELERWAAQGQLEPLAEVLGRDIEIDTAATPDAADLDLAAGRTAVPRRRARRAGRRA
jgi:exopolyphosphatase / guanosine-5'-triphosphate,3'-diphosphate pyrophosphatase